MIVFSTKTLWGISRILFLYFILVMAGGRVAFAFEPEFRLELNSRLAYHTFGAQDLASHRHTLEAEQKFKWRKWTLVAGAEGYAETAFTTSSRYGGEVAKNESQLVIPRDVYLQYKTPRWLVRAGNQQLVWGEAFGFYFADIINPKDTREFGLGDLSRQRIPIPMLSTKVYGERSTVEWVYIPKPFFNRIPSKGNDFYVSYQSLFSENPVPMTDERSLPFALENSEVGMRVGTKVGVWDLGVFYFYYHDREPKYQLALASLSPLVLALEGTHPRLQTVGTTGATEWGGWVLRWEALYTWDRFFPFVDQGTYQTFSTQETTAVLGVEYSAIPQWRLGLQASDAYLTDVPSTTLTPRHRPLLSAMVSGPTISDQSMDLILSYVPTDKSALLQAKYLMPLSSRIELQLGADVLWGDPSSQFGRFRSASRGYVLLKAFLAGR